MTEAESRKRRVVEIDQLCHRDLSSPDDFEVDSGFAQRLANRAETLIEEIEGEQVVVSNVGGRYHRVDPRGLGGASELQRRLHRGGPVVEAGQDVAVQVDQRAASR